MGVSLYAQTGSSEALLPEESFYAHLNGSLFLPGEYLHFKLYGLSAKDKSFDALSKIAYAELLNDKAESVYKKTIYLSENTGYSDFFIPTTLASGNYKFIAYSSFMLNNKEQQFFEQDVFIVNPYTSNQKDIWKDSLAVDLDDSIANQSPNNSKIELAKNSFSKREKVRGVARIPDGNYSVSVRMLDSIPSPKLTSLENYVQTFLNSPESLKLSDLKYTPESRGKILKGQLASTTNDLQSKNIALSIPVLSDREETGEEFYLSFATTDKNGRFILNINEAFSGNDGFIQVLDSNHDFNIEIDSFPVFEKTTLSFSDFGITAGMENTILKRSIYNQIENSFFIKKPDTLLLPIRKNIFDWDAKETFVLDDYKRFKSVRETFIEVVSYARLSRENEGYQIHVFGYPPYEEFWGEALLIVDGIPILDVGKFVDRYNSEKIEKIKVIREKKFLGGRFYKGVVLIETFDLDFAQNQAADYVKSININSGNITRSYFKQTYSEKSRLPDYRTQLLWDPNLELDFDNSFDFYTSDVKGEFEISIQGFTKEGKPVSLYNTFMVE